MSSQTDLFVFAGEVSGDLHGEALLSALQAKRPDLTIVGVGGPCMRGQGMECIMPMEKFQVMGFVDVFLSLPTLMKQFYEVRREILKRNPKAVVCIDYPGFNLRLEKSLRKKGFNGKLCHYISPTVWAWAKGRIKTLVENLDLLLVIFPFEKEIFSATSLHVEYIGHPLISRIRSYSYEELPFLKGKEAIGLFPGSREKEIVRNLPKFLHVANRLLEEWPDLVFPISLSHERFRNLIEDLVAKENLPKEKFCLVPSEKRYDLMKMVSAAMAKSGTVTLELALHRVPTVVTYAVSKLDLFIAKKILGIVLPNYCIVNIICKKTVFPELIGPNFNEDRLYEDIKSLFLQDNRDVLAVELDRLSTLLESKNTSEEAASHILKLLDSSEAL